LSSQNVKETGCFELHIVRRILKTISFTRY